MVADTAKPNDKGSNLFCYPECDEISYGFHVDKHIKLVLYEYK